LLWVGGLVTTTDAGMAVPDWPTTYGYNLFLYPWQTWLAGPWDIFVEHGHRLLGALVGALTIVLAAVLWRTERRPWMRWLGVASLSLVIFQGVLGGMRVVLDERTIAMLHACTGPLFFALTVAIVIFTSRRWQIAQFSPAVAASWALHRFAVATFIFVYLRIVLGAVLRHVPIAAEPATFALAVRFHLFLAAVLTLHVTALVGLVWFRARRVQPLGGLAGLLAGLLVAQLGLGAGTWIVKFAAPSWAPRWVSLGTSAVQEGGPLQTHVITAHVAVGSLLLVTSLALALHAARLAGVRNPLGSVLLGRREAAV
jgi:cytochrome c oxidase assembly protein subunit 15